VKQFTLPQKLLCDEARHTGLARGRIDAGASGTALDYGFP
jgi:hypothetical protein